MDTYDFTKLKKSHKSLLNKFEFLIEEGFMEYEEFALDLFEMNSLPNTRDTQIAEQIFYRNLNDRNNKFEQKVYYVSNTICFLKCTRNILSEDFLEFFRNYNPSKNDLMVYNYFQLFQQLLYDSMILLELYEEDILGEKSRNINVWKNPIQHNLTLYHNLKQAIFGQLSFHANRNLEIDFSVTRIRNMIELRLRQAFDVMGACHSSTNSFVPIQLDDILEVLKKFQDDFEIDVPIHIIRRVYSWANIYVHAGIKDFTWKPLFILEYFKTLMSGSKRDGKLNADNGIRISEDTFNKIRQSIESSIGPENEILSIRKPKVEFY